MARIVRFNPMSVQKDRMDRPSVTDEAIGCFENVPQPVLEAIDGLRYNSMRVVLVAVDNDSLMGNMTFVI